MDNSPQQSRCTFLVFLLFNPFLKNFIHLFTFWRHWVFVAARGLSLVVASGGYSSLPCMGCSLRWLLLLWSTSSRRASFSSCGTWAQYLWCTGLVAPWHVGSSQTRARTRVPCIGRQILNHCATREVLIFFFNGEISRRFWITRGGCTQVFISVIS